MPSTVISMLMKEFDFHGPAMSVSAMCACANAGSDHGQVVARLRHRHRRHPAGHRPVRASPERPPTFSDLGVAVLDAPPFEACRPFQEGSRGFVGGEAAVAMVLSDQPGRLLRRRARRCHDHGRLNLVGDRPRPPRRSFAASARRWPRRASTPTEVAYLNAHGPGTAQCDAAEGQILDELFPDAHGIFSVKPLVGHCQAAAAAVEILATIYAFQTGFIPAPPPGGTGPSPAGRRPHAARCPDSMIKSSIGMGGLQHRRRGPHRRPDPPTAPPGAPAPPALAPIGTQGVTWTNGTDDRGGHATSLPPARRRLSGPRPGGMGL